MSFAWIADKFGELLFVLVGGSLVILANHVAENRKERFRQQSKEDDHYALMTAVFAIRNFTVEAIDKLGDLTFKSDGIASLKIAQSNLQSVIEKSRSETDRLMICLFELNLRLSHLIIGLDGDKIPTWEIESRVKNLDSAIEQFDLISGSDLSFIADEELADMVGNPEDIPE